MDKRPELSDIGHETRTKMYRAECPVQWREAAMRAFRSRVFYPWKQGVEVTDTEFRVDGRRFALRDLKNVGRQHGSMHAARQAAVEIIVVESALVAIVLAVATAMLSPLLVVGAVAALYLISGVPTVLFSSSDPVEFGKVSRALMRAVEQHRDLARPT
jgi:hypothetical protein